MNNSWYNAEWDLAKAESKTCVRLGVKPCGYCENGGPPSKCSIDFITNEIDYNICTGSNMKEHIIGWVKWVNANKNVFDITWFHAAIKYNFPQYIDELEKLMVLM